MNVYQGVILPTDKGSQLCDNARESYDGTVDRGSCNVLSVFWISNIMTHLDGNYALGGNTCYWVLPHHNEIGRGMSNEFTGGDGDNNSGTGGGGTDGGNGGDDTGKGGEAGLRKILKI